MREGKNASENTQDQDLSASHEQESEKLQNNIQFSYVYERPYVCSSISNPEGDKKRREPGLRRSCTGKLVCMSTQSIEYRNRPSLTWPS